MNRPQSLRDANEKLFALRFPQCIPPTLVTRAPSRLREFLAEHEDIVVKPLDIMGGTSVFRVRRDDPNITVIFDTMTVNGTRTIMAQRFLPEIAEGDKRILLIDGEPVPYALARVPARASFAATSPPGARVWAYRSRRAIAGSAPKSARRSRRAGSCSSGST